MKIDGASFYFFKEKITENIKIQFFETLIALLLTKIFHLRSIVRHIILVKSIVAHIYFLASFLKFSALSGNKS